MIHPNFSSKVSTYSPVLYWAMQLWNARFLIKDRHALSLFPYRPLLMLLYHCWPLEGAQSSCYFFPKVRTLLPQIWCVQNLKTFHSGTLKSKSSVCHPLGTSCPQELSNTWPAHLLLGWGGPDLSSLPSGLLLSYLALTRANYCGL